MRVKLWGHLRPWKDLRALVFLDEKSGPMLGQEGGKGPFINYVCTKPSFPSYIDFVFDFFMKLQ